VGGAGYGNVEDKGKGLVMGIGSLKGRGWLWDCGR